MSNQSPTNPDVYVEVADPTWHDDIKFFFRQSDMDCMGPKGIDLSRYQAVRDKSSSIYSRVRRRDGPRRMPTDLAWTEERVRTFRNWVINDFKVGESGEAEVPDVEAPETRERKSLHDLSSQEEADLLNAFQEIMALNTDDPNSYWSVTSAHGLPTPYDCVHGSEQFNHWHRLYLLQMENALRSIPGCEHVTIPYWDLMQSSIPDILNRPLFSSYSWPSSKGAYKTSRNSNSGILQSIVRFGIRSNIQLAMNESWYEDFWMTLEDNSHDPGHGSIGGSNSNPSYASFDPIFWFFHCYWDKLLWDWQVGRNATSLASFKSNMRDFTSWLEDDIKIGATRAKSKDLVDNRQIDLATVGLGSGIVGVAYVRPELPEPAPLLASTELKSRSISAAATFEIPEEPVASVMLKGVHRLNIDGSFEMRLFAGEEEVASTFEFQFLDPSMCPNCVEKPIRNYKMMVPVSVLEKGPLRVEMRRAEDSALIDMVEVGSPTLNVRMLLE